MPAGPARLGPFDLFSPVGEGGMGQVWRGAHSREGVPVAVKVIRAEQAFDPGHQAALRHEVRQVARLDHPHIVLLLEQGEVTAEAEQATSGRLVAGSPWWAMEYASAGSLDAAPPPRDWPEVRRLLATLLDALAHAHAHGVLHRDVKPGNILLSHPDDLRPGIKVSDFGLAITEAGPAHERFQVVGTPDYMAPEQILGRWRDQGPWTDLYAVGCLAFQLARGTPPFQSRDRNEVFRGHLFEPIPALLPLFDVPPDLQGWVQRLLAKEPARRFRHAADAARALAALGEARPEGGSGQTLPLDVPGSDGAALRGDAAPAGSPHSHPPRPWVDWRRPEAQRAPRQLVGAGLGLYGLRSVPLVGRVEERDRLWRALRRVVESGRPRAVVLRGPSGHGKTRLARWVATRAAEVGLADALYAAHSRIPGPGQGLGRMLARHLGGVGLEGQALRDRVEEVLRRQGLSDPEEWRALARVLGEGADAGPPSERYALLARHLARSARERPLVMVLDDVQWGLDALGFVAWVLDHADEVPLPVLALLTCRDDAVEERPDEEAALSELLHHDDAGSFFIGPLPPADHAALVHELLGLEGSLAEAVGGRTAGNPLFAVQLVGDWVSRGVLEVSGGGFALRKGEEAPLPGDIYHLWRDRLDRVLRGQPDGARAALEVAAALGQEVDEDDWDGACRAMGVPLPDGLAEALLSANLADPRERGWAFVHGMLRETVETDAARDGTLAACHRACAAMLRRRPARADREERLGRHLLAAGELEESLGPLLAGAGARLRAGEFRAARALHDLRDPAMTRAGVPHADPRWGEGWLGRASALLGIGDFEAAARLAERTVEAGRRHRWSTVPRALRYRGMAAQKQGDLLAAEALFAQARSLAEEAGQEDEAARCLLYQGTVARLKGDTAEAVRSLLRGLAAFERVGDDLGRADTLGEIASARVAAGEDDLGAADLVSAIELYGHIGRPVGVAACRNALGDVLRRKGDLDGAERAYRDAWAGFERAGSHARVFPLLNLGLVLAARGSFGEAYERLEEALGAAVRSRRRVVQGVVHALLVPVAAARGAWDDFDRHLAAADDLLSATGTVDRDAAEHLRWGAELARAEGDAERTAKALDLARTQWEGLGEPMAGPTGPA